MRLHRICGVRFRSHLRSYARAYAYRGLTAFASLSMAVSVGGIGDWVMKAAFIMAMIVGFVAAMMAFYIPLVPYVMWMLGLAGIFVMYIEALIAAPIWIVAHAIPGGETALGQHVKAGYMIMLSLFMRPTLMVFGFFAAFFVNIIMFKLVLVTYPDVIASASGENLMGIVSILAYLTIFVGLILALIHRSFGLIHEIPRQSAPIYWRHE
ncbi:MAG: DotA/TraY family protein [Candidatus Thiodiazotropha endolucinida]